MKTLLVAAALLVMGCGRDTLGYSCESSSECAAGQECVLRQQVTVSFNGTDNCDVNYKICTVRCSSSNSSACTAAGGVCNGADSCGGAKNLCTQS